MGLDIGLESAGLDVRVAQELDAVACKTIRANGRAVVEGDIRQLLESDPALNSVLDAGGVSRDELFAVVGGPPCQSFSTAGKRLGIGDSRGLLIFDYITAISKLNPRFAILENVKGMPHTLGASGQPLLAEIVDRFNQIGYSVTYGLVDAVHYGTPQFRERFIILASRDDEDTFLPIPTHFQKHQSPGLRWKTFDEATADLTDDPGEYLQFSPRVRAYLEQVPEGGNWKSLPSEVAMEAMGGAWKSGGGKVGFYRRISGREPSPTLVTSPIQKATMLAHPREVRPLSVKEYARLQGFPDNWKFAGTVTQQYRQIGNAVPTQLGSALGEALAATANGDSHIQTKRTRGTSVHQVRDKYWSLSTPGSKQGSAA